MRWIRSRMGLLLLSLCLSACMAHAGPYAVPEGFAVYEGRKPFKAVSPDGVLFRVRKEKNKPRADLPFWKEALKKRMKDAGYVFSKESSISTDNQKGYLLELTAPLSRADYTYLIAIFVQKREITIVESAGEVSKFAPRRDAIVAAINKIKL